MRKLPVVARQASEKGLVELIDPGSLNPAKLLSLHDPAYVNSFLSGVGPLASSQGWGWTPKIRDGVLAIQAGQIKGSELAMEMGIAANMAQGFHHSGYYSGSGFCTFNGLALVAQEFPHLKVGVLDCDQHQGNGTAEFTERLPNLYNYTIYGSSFGAPTSERSIHRPLRPCTHQFETYLQAVRDGLNQLVEWQVDLCIYQAGVDCHINDPFGNLGLTTAQLKQRDQVVFEFLKIQALPVLFVLAGGYQEPIETALAPLHVATFEMAYSIYNK